MEDTSVCSRSRVPFRDVANNVTTRGRCCTKTKQNVVGRSVAKNWVESPLKGNRVPSKSLPAFRTSRPLALRPKKTSFIMKCPSEAHEDSRVPPPENKELVPSSSACLVDEIQDSFASFFSSLPECSNPAAFCTPTHKKQEEPQNKNYQKIPGSDKDVPVFLPCDKRYPLCADAILEAIEGNNERLSPQRLAEMEDEFILIHPRNMM